jgi:hypothetical protein
MWVFVEYMWLICQSLSLKIWKYNLYGVGVMRGLTRMCNLHLVII